ncbi:MAG: hypothetical protein ACI8SC_000023 [Colwellia sp.]|jgi:hypothetical protein
MKYPTLFTSLSLSILLSTHSSSPVTASMSTTRFDNPEASSEPLKVNLAVRHGSRTTLAIEDTYITRMVLRFMVSLVVISLPLKV